MTTYGELRSHADIVEDRRLFDRVQKGLALLKEKWGEDFADHIDLGLLDLGNSCACVLGQLYADAEPTAEQWNTYEYEVGFAVEKYDADGYVRGLAILDGDVCRQPWAYGFDRTPDDTFRELNDEWRAAIVLEREAR